MNYYIDFEFNENFTRPFIGVGKRYHYIDLISVGIVSNDGREYSAISKEYSYERCNDWVKKNVIKPLYWKTVSGDQRNRWQEENFHQQFGMTNKEIATEIEAYISVSDRFDGTPVFYGYFADYDWVLLCSLYGTMMNLPPGWPMYCRDLKQMLDETAESLIYKSYTSLEERVEFIKSLAGYPQDDINHDALGDARWNRNLHKFLLDFKVC